MAEEPTGLPETQLSPQPQKRHPLPDGLARAIYGCAGASAVLMLAPFVWVLALPLSAFSVVAGIYAAGKYKRTNGMMWAVIGGAAIFFWGWVEAQEARYQINRAAEEERRYR